jgi:putative transposase
MDRTIVAQLHPTPEQAQVLKRTIEEHTACFNAVADLGFTLKCSNGVELHKATYYDLRQHYPDLPAQLVCAARVKATEAVKSALTWQKKHEARYPKKVAQAKKQGRPEPKFKPVRVPHSKICPVRYDARSYWVKWEMMTTSVATIAGRVQVRFTVPEFAREYVGGNVCSADLCYRKGKFTLHIVVSLPEPVVEPSGDVIGVDLGLNRPAVMSNRHFLGERRWKEQERRLFRIRRKLQSKGTKSAKRHLKKLSGKLFRQRKDHDHVLSKRIVQYSTPGSTIVFENLTNIRATSKIGRGKQNKNVDTKRRLHSWSFAQLYDFTSYKAAACGSVTAKVDPRHTSQTCNRCGYQHRSNRRSQSLFKCRNPQCGYTINADYNASLNIRDKHIAYLAEVDISSSAGGPVMPPIVSTLRSEEQAPTL